MPDWVLKGPSDLEYTRYMLLAEIESIKSELANYNLESALHRVDDSIDFLYRYDAERSISNDNFSNYELTGNNIFDFHIKYERDKSDQDEILDVLCNEAINLFEDLHASIRVIWREIEEGINISYVPNKKLLLNSGFVFITTPDNKLHSYYFTRPTKYITNWELFKLEHLSTSKYTKDSYFKQLEEVDFKNTDNIIFKIQCNNSVKIENYAIAVIKNMIYIKLKKDYIF